MGASVFRKDMSWATQAFQDNVWPQLAQYCGKGTLHVVEGSTTKDLCKRLDMNAGIDGFQELADGTGMRGLAWRVQRAICSYATFTIRYARESGAKTEYEKRKLALDNPQLGLVCPHITIHAYVDTGHNLVSAAIVYTRDLFEFIDKHIGHAIERKHNWKRKNDPVFLKSVQDNGAADFLCVRWDALRDAGYKIVVLEQPPVAAAAE